jgi:predicted nucleic acid-binding protein
MKKLRLFLDTTVLLSAILNRNKTSWALLNIRHSPLELATNLFAIKELRRALKDDYRCADEKINKSIDFVYEMCKVVKEPRKEEFLRFKLRDKNDRPIVCSAVKEKCDFLVTEDRYLKEDAEKYIPTIAPIDLVVGRKK